MEAKRVLVVIGDVIVCAALAAGFVLLLRQFNRQDLAPLGLISPILYAWWRGYIPVLKCVGGCAFLTFSTFLFWGHHAGIVDWVWVYSLLVLACLILGGLSTYPWRTTDRPH